MELGTEPELLAPEDTVMLESSTDPPTKEPPPEVKPSWTGFAVSVAAWLCFTLIVAGAYTAARHNALWCDSASNVTVAWEGSTMLAVNWSVCPAYDRALGRPLNVAPARTIDGSKGTGGFQNYVAAIFPDKNGVYTLHVARNGNFSLPLVSNLSCPNSDISALIQNASSLVRIHDTDSLCTNETFNFTTSCDDPSVVAFAETIANDLYYMVPQKTAFDLDILGRRGDKIAAPYGLPKVTQVDNRIYINECRAPVWSPHYPVDWNLAALGVSIAMEQMAPKESGDRIGSLIGKESNGQIAAIAAVQYSQSRAFAASPEISALVGC